MKDCIQDGKLKGNADVEISKPSGQFIFPFFCIQTKQMHKRCVFLVSLMEIIRLRQLLLGDESEINTITVIVLLKKKKKKVDFFF